MDLRLSYGKGFRSPTLQELYYDFYHVNGGGFWVRGNPDLKAETSDSYMASYTWRALHGGDVRLTTVLSAFLNNYKDRIQRLQSVENSLDLIYFNTGKYRTIGFSLENTLSWKRLQASLNVSYIGRYNIYQDDEEYASQKQDKMRYSPEVSASVSYDWRRVAKFNLFYKFTGKRSEYFVSNDKLVTGGLEAYSWLDISLSRQIIKGLDISAGVKNALDIKYIDRTGSGAAGTMSGSVLSSGRSYFMGLAYSFNK